MINRLPDLGVGLGFRPMLRKGIDNNTDQIDFLEIIADHYFNPPPKKLRELNQISQRFPVIPHAIGLSLGTDSQFNRSYLDNFAQLCDSIEAPWCSEHLAFTSVHGREIGHLSPLPFTHEAVDVVTKKIRTAQDTLPVPLILENITYLLEIPGSQMTEPEFLTAVVESTGCGLLLDITNVYTNATNHGFDPVSYLNSIPLNQVVQIHLAGGFWQDDLLIDSHSCSVPDAVWNLLSHLIERVEVKGILIERDDGLTDFEQLLGELRNARQIWKGTDATV